MPVSMLVTMAQWYLLARQTKTHKSVPGGRLTTPNTVKEHLIDSWAKQIEN
jgi:hypothetical protein